MVTHGDQVPCTYTMVIDYLSNDALAHFVDLSLEFPGIPSQDGLLDTVIALDFNDGGTGTL